MKKQSIFLIFLLFSLSCTNIQTSKMEPQQRDPNPDLTSSPATPLSTAIPNPVEQNGAVTTVQEIYKLHFKENQRFETKIYKEWLDPQLYSLLAKDEEESAKFTDEIAGLDFNPLTNAQDEVGGFTLTTSTTSTNEVAINVAFANEIKNNTPEIRVILKMIKNNSKWQIKNIFYPGENGKTQDLLSILGEIEKERKSLKKEKNK